ncbi:methyl farnesoate epoxidase [Daphnia magna]|uniref:methyl farnesoate epoxidase n=1 Tax=Daphnia magna TaxID=35525 RepID=UPI001E1BCEFD|nr:methyl farnesoate epoxidase [Daphnia magna]
MIFEFCLTIFLVGLTIKATKRPHNFPPGPRGLPLLGYLPFLSSWDPQYPHKAMKKISEVYGPVVGMYFGLSKPIISVCGHEAVKEALHNEDLDGRPYIPAALGRTFGEHLGLMFVMGQFWQEQRRFAMRHLRDLGFGKTSIEDQMTDELGDLIKDIENGSELDPERIVDLKGIFQVSVINILWAIIAGERFQRNDPKFQELLRANEMMFRAGNPVRGNIPIPAFVLKHFRFAREFIGIKSELIKPFQKFVQVTIDDHQQQNPCEGEARDFIDVYLKEMNKQKDENPSTNFTNKQLISMITELFGAGAESTSSSIGFAIIHLIRHQQAQQKMQIELDQVCGQFFPTLNHRSSLPYTEAVLMEAQRCSTIAPFAVPHSAVKDTHIQGYTIPKGSVVLLNLDAVLQDSKYWKDPEVFRPERHLNENGTKVIKSDHFYPFGLGRRMCLGDSLAKNTYFLFTAALIKKFRFEPVENEPLPSLNPKIGFTLGYQGFKAVVTPRS